MDASTDQANANAALAAEVRALRAELAAARGGEVRRDDAGRGESRGPAAAWGERRFQAMVDHAWEAVTLVDAGGRIVYASPGVTRMLGYRPSELVARPFVSLAPPDAAAATAQRLAEAIASPGRPVVFEHRAVGRDGSVRQLESTLTNLLDDPDVRAIVANCHDVTDARAATDAIAAGEERLRTSTRAARMTTWRWDVAGGRVYVAPQAQDFAPGFAGTIGAFWSAIEPAEHEALLRAAGRAAASPDGAFHAQFRLSLAGGPARWVQADGTLSRDDAGRAAHVAGVLRDVSGERAAADALSEAESRAKAAFDGSLDALFFLRAERGPGGEVVDFTFVDLNFRAEALAGRTRRELVGRRVSEACPAERSHGLVDRYAEVVRTRRPAQEEVRVCAEAFGLPGARPGDVAWLQQAVVPWGDGVSVARRDVTGPRREQAAAAAAHASLRAMVEASPLAIVRMNVDTVVELWSPGAERLFGWTAAEAVGRPLPIIPLESMDEFRANWAAALASETVRGFEARRARKDGTRLDLSVWAAPIKDGAGQTIGVVALMADVGERKRFERTLRASEARYRTMIERSPLGVQTFRPDGTCLSANAAWEVLWEAPASSVIGLNVLDDPQLAELGVADVLRRAFAGDPTAGCPPFHYDPAKSGTSGRPRWVQPHVYRLSGGAGANDVCGDGSGGESRGGPEVVVILQDVTAQQAFQRDLNAAKSAAEEASAAKDRFMAALSHELRTPLAPVLATVSALQADASVPPPLMDDLGMIRRNVELEARLIDDLLDVTRIAKGTLDLRPADVDLRQCLADSVEVCRPEADARRVNLTLGPVVTRQRVRADPARLRQVFWNLVQNAVKFTPAGGSVTVVANDDASGGTVAIDVADTGIGLPDDFAPGTFGPSEQGRTATGRWPGGLGLGLAIAQGIVTQHGGTMSATTAGPDRGSTFTVRLPATPEPATGEPAPLGLAADVPAGLKAKHILLVEDHEDTLRIMAKVIGMLGYDVTPAGTVAIALDCAGRTPFDLVVSDLGLPDGSGLELMRELRSRHGLSGVALSGYGLPEDVVQSKAAGFLEHLVKPVDLQKLKAVIGRCVA